MRFSKLILFAILILPLAAAAQNDTIKKIVPLGRVIIWDYQLVKTSVNVEYYSLRRIEYSSPFNLSDGLAKLPGISQMTTGSSISKPVIRGLYGNRVLVLLSGVRFDNQQWQDEHGMGLSQIGIDRVEVIKGPASLLYGTDAVGGVINVIEESAFGDRDSIQTQRLDINTRFYSNTLGTLTDVGYKSGNARKGWRIRLGYENHGDYSDGNGNRVLNSRSKGYYLKAGFGFNKRGWQQQNSYNFSYNQYGFILDDLGSFFNPDARWSRGMEGPHHNVILNVFNSKNTFFLGRSMLYANMGIQSNVRMEDEGGGQISLNMHLFSALENLRWESKIANRLQLTINQQFSYQNNTNYGGRIIIPDADMLENNLSALIKYSYNNFIIEAGVGLTHKYFKTYQTLTLNSPDKEIHPFTKNKLAGNGMLGVYYSTSEIFNIKANVATGVRAANLAELSSNGLHEGVFRYEVGDPNLKPEQNINTDITLEVDKGWFFVSLSGFYNRFYNYIYLAPTNSNFFGFQVFRYKQQNAFLTGGEAMLIIKPPVKWLRFKEAFSSTYAKLDDGGYLPFIPAFKLTSSLRVNFLKGARFDDWYAEPEFDYVFAQNRPAQFETNTPAYCLLNFNAGVTQRLRKKGEIEYAISCKNLLNVQYADHLSRLKYYGLYNMGLNIVFSVKFKLDL